MKKASLICLALLALTGAAQANIVLNFIGGQLFGANTSSPLPNGTLIQVILSRTTGSGFDAPTPSSFTGNSADDIILASFVVDNSQGFPGGFGSPPISFDLGNGIDTGDQLLLRWFVGLTASSPTPVAGGRYGQFRTDITQTADGSNFNWTVPGDAANGFITFYTNSETGSNPDSAGLANLFVTAIPEPSTFALLGVGLAGAAFLRRRTKAA